MECYGLCDSGLIRKINQDAIFMDIKGELGCFCVADGMGGHENGEMASQEIVKCVSHWWEKVQDPDSFDQFEQLKKGLFKAISDSNTNIRSFTNIRDICGSTVVAILIWRQYYALLSAGDSRVYLINKKNKIRQMTRDDVWENNLNIKIKKCKLKKYSTYGKLTNAIGIDDEVKLNVTSGIINDEKGFILCSDGLHKMINERAINKQLRSLKEGDLSQIVMRLKEKVYSKGARDNISIILVRI